jgi:hypothetical protein
MPEDGDMSCSSDFEPVKDPRCVSDEESPIPIVNEEEEEPPPVLNRLRGRRRPPMRGRGGWR